MTADGAGECRAQRRLFARPADEERHGSQVRGPDVVDGAGRGCGGAVHTQCTD